MEYFCDLLVQSSQRVRRRGVHLGGLVGQRGYQSRVVLQLDGPRNRHLLRLLVFYNFGVHPVCRLHSAL